VPHLWRGRRRLRQDLDRLRRQWSNRRGPAFDAPLLAATGAGQGSRRRAHLRAPAGRARDRRHSCRRHGNEGHSRRVPLAPRRERRQTLIQTERRMRAFMVWLGVGWFAVLSACRAEDWPGWRGPTGQGVSKEKDLPIKWGGKDRRNVRWQALLPG